jgi:alkanesulfonate monooxygenase SsuD/methylene tetrahydromethanopterin reductase-like flavin-dependent oxidoreductase (luciferase family)
MTLKFGLIVPQGWRMDLVGISDPVEAYETMTRVAKEAEALGFDSIWLYDHFHTVPTPRKKLPLSAGQVLPRLPAIRIAFVSDK